MEDNVCKLKCEKFIPDLLYLSFENDLDFGEDNSYSKVAGATYGSKTELKQNIIGKSLHLIQDVNSNLKINNL